MEKYIIDNAGRVADEISVLHGKYYDRIHKKHKDTYGEYGAENIRDNITTTFRDAMLLLQSPQKSNNMLLIGKVQSGKTSNLELFTALAFDNGFNMVVIYGGYDGTLLSQTTERFRKTFDVPSDACYSNDSPVIFSSDDSAQLLTVDNEIIEDLMEANKPIFLISMKRPAAMKKVNQLLGRIDKTQLKAFIIDDEGDQASLNTKKNKEVDASATYAEIIEMKDHLEDPLYISATATPQALVFQDEYSRLRPDTIRLIEPGVGYCGVDEYHLYDSGKIELINDDDQQELADGVLGEAIRNALRHYIIASAIMYNRELRTSEMIIHTHRTVDDHNTIYRLVDAFIQEFKNQVEYEDDDSLEIRKEEYKSTYKQYFSESVQAENQFDELWDIICKRIIGRVYLILKNSTGRLTQANEVYRKYKIFIGGDLLQRGVTFPGLVTTFFSRWAKGGGNMDTNLQRARWFGYREKWIDICKIFTSENIAREFTNLSEIETDLWEQFYSIQAGEMQIDDILIKADNTKQKPTRKPVASYTTVSFRNKWIKQRMGIFDLNQVRVNNKIVDDLLAKYVLQETNAGRRDGLTTAKYAIIDRMRLSRLIEHMQAVFDLEPFERRPLMDLIESDDDIPVIIMPDVDGSGRKRSFYPNNKIFALQQGADNKDSTKAVFLGDSSVVVNKDKINIQVHKIIPQKKSESGVSKLMEEYTQYMFAIYVPKAKKYYVKG